MLDRRLLAALCGALSLFAVACDNNGDGNDPNGPATICKFPVAVSNATGKSYGEACTTNAECEYGKCMMPGETGNITNTKFGFCTRACDCNNDNAAKIPAQEKEALDCIYPTTPAQHYRHVVIQCTSLQQCQDISPEWTACKNPGVGVASVCTAL